MTESKLPELTLPLFTQFNKLDQPPFEKGKHILIDSFASLQDLSTILLSYTRIGIDTEQSFAKTYEGFLCLIQISTRDADYLVDVLTINNRRAVHEALQPVFANKNIVKIFYAGSQDILWLQRDFDIIVINFFDIRECANYLNKSGDNSLIDLIQRFCGHSLSRQKKKELQISEWSTRPLSEEQLEYAALDSHFLEKIRFELLTEAIHSLGFKRILSFIRTLQQTTLKKYEQKKFDATIAFDGFQKYYTSKTPTAIILQRTIDKSTDEFKLLSVLAIKLMSFVNDYALSKNLNVVNLLPEDSLMKLLLIAFDNTSKKLKPISERELNPEFIESILNPKFPPSKDFLESSLVQIVNTMNSWEGNQENFLEEFRRQSSRKVGTHQQMNERKEKRTQMFESNFSLKKDPYGNGVILSPEGFKLCHCDERKAQWYLGKGLATLESTNPSVIRLNFQPNGIPHEELKQEILLDDNSFYANKRECLCVVCGKTENYTKYHVVPSVYRTNFPNKFKSHRSHDILLLCVRCHQKAGKYSDLLKEEYLKKYSIEKKVSQKQETLKFQVKGIDISLREYLRKKEEMSKESRKKLRASIREYIANLLAYPSIEDRCPELIDFSSKFGGEKIKITQALRDFISDLKNSKGVLQKDDLKNNEKVWLGQKVVESLKSEEQLIEFIKAWRQHFLDVMEPKFLPPGWDVNHKFDREFGKDSIFNSTSTATDATQESTDLPRSLEPEQKSESEEANQVN